MRPLTQAKILSAAQQIRYRKLAVVFPSFARSENLQSTKESTGLDYKWATSLLFFFPNLWPSELQSLVKHNKWDFQNVDSYHQVSITSSNTQTSASIWFNKELHINRHPLKPKTIKTLHSWWMLSKFRESKAYLQTQYEHGMNIAINPKAASALFSPYSEKSKYTGAKEKTHTLPNLTVGHDWFQSSIGVSGFLRRPPSTVPFRAPQRLQLSLARVPEEDAVSSCISEPQLQKMLLRKRKEKKVWH